MPSHLLRILVGLAACVALSAGVRAADAPAGEADAAWFTAKVLPVFKSRCYECHSHSKKLKAGLALDYRSGWVQGGDNGPAVVPGEPDKSLLIKAIRYTDPDLRMPPKGKLDDAEIAILTEWVKRGAPDPRVKPTPTKQAAAEWWSLRPLTRPAVPRADAANPIDAFVLAKLREKGLTPSPEADRRTLIRRLTFDLHGLPPTPAEADAFIADKDPQAYEKLVDRLLASPQYGERWARHWMDVIHFADTHGFEHDRLRPNAWRYRDYLIDSFNRDTPWPRFIREQLAADRFYPEEPRLTAALGFLGAGPYDQSTATTAPRTFDYLDRDDLVTQTMAAFAGSTVNCARCHDHKFDPISQEDYYALHAVFAGVTKGELRYDEDAAVATARRKWTTLLDAAKGQKTDILLAAENEAIVSEWERSSPTVQSAWAVLDADAIVSSDGSTLKRNDDHSVSSTGERPERDDYTVVATPALSELTGIRLEVLADPSLPKNGPGRQDNGNLHLTEFEVLLFLPGKSDPQPLKFRRATADWDQQGWTIAQALDGNPKTAWGIYPRVGQSHHAVFELEKKLAVPSGAKLVIVLKQLHGQGHLIGRFRLSATSAEHPSTGLVPDDVVLALKTPAESRTPDQRLAVARYALRTRAESELAKLPPQAMVYAAGRAVEIDGAKKALATPQTIRLLQRGDIDRPAALVNPGALSAVESLTARFAIADTNDESARRAALADWLADPQNPLTWRVAANRVWHDHFGRGICDSPSDLGRMGGTPSHPALLDWLACELRDHGGSIKHLHRLIVTSAAYRQSAESRDEPAKIDGDNRLLWRMSRRRLDAESFYDAVLSVSGRLDLTVGGPGIQHFKLGPLIQDTPSVDYTAYDWTSPGAGRRSVYRVVWRAIPNPFMEALDFPDASMLSPVRGFSASPLLALTLYNNPFMLKHSQWFAERLTKQSPDVEAQVRQAFRMALLRDPTAEESRALAEYARRHGLPAMCRVLLNSNEFLFVE